MHILNRKGTHTLPSNLVCQVNIIIVVLIIVVVVIVVITVAVLIYTFYLSNDIAYRTICSVLLSNSTVLHTVD